MKKITICACSSRTIMKEGELTRLAVAASKAGWQVELVPDLCEMCEENVPELQQVAGTTIVACHERAVKSLLEWRGFENCTLLNMRGREATDVLQELGLDAAEDEALAEQFKEQLDRMPRKMGEDAWYPTLDKDVCGECGKCFDFCPFGVYEMIDDRVRVVHPHSCKNNCPACARNCPHSAIIFPKYDRSPINGGKERQERAVQLESRSLYNDAFRAKLAQRRAGVSLLKKE